MSVMEDIQGSLTDIKAARTKTDEMLATLRSEVDAVKGRFDDVVDRERIERIEADVAAKIAAEQKATDARLAALEAGRNRPGASGASAEDAERKAAFFGMLRGKVGEAEYKSMQESSGPDGGFLVMPTMADGIVSRKRRSSPLRGVANVVSISGNEYDVPLEFGDMGAGWVGETQTRSATTTATIDLVKIPVHEMHASPKITQRMLDDAAFDIEAWLVERIGARLGRLEATAFVAGDGVAKPKGFTAYSTAATADASRAAGTLEHVATGTSGGFDGTNPADAFISLLYALHPDHRAMAVWGAASATLATIAKFKDGDGNYLLHRMADNTAPSGIGILGRPVVEMEDMPAIAANSLSVVCGNFAAGYTIVERVGITVLRDPFSSKPFVLFYTTQRVGGAVTDFDAIKLLKLAA